MTTTEPFAEAVETFTKRKSRWPKRPAGAFDVAAKVYSVESRKFNEADWQRNSGRFANYIGQGPGGRGGGGSARGSAGAATGAPPAGHQRPGQRPRGSGAGGKGAAAAAAKKEILDGKHNLAAKLKDQTDVQRKAYDAITRDSASKAGTDPEGWNVNKKNPPDRDTQQLHKDADGNYSPERKAIHDAMVAHVTDGKPIKEEGDRTFFILGGGGGSGKTTLVNAGIIGVPNADSSVTINADDCKERLPEYGGLQRVNNPDAASIVHEESSDMTKEQTKAGYARGSDVVLDGVGDGSVKSLKTKVDEARGKGYKVKGVYINTDTQQAVDAAEDRSNNPESDSYKRNVPEGRLRGDHKKVTTTFNEALDAGLYDEVEVYDNHWTKPPKATLIASARPRADGSPPRREDLVIHDQAAWDRFQAKANEDPEKRTIGKPRTNRKTQFDLTDILRYYGDGGKASGKEVSRMATKAKRRKVDWDSITTENWDKLSLAGYTSVFPKSVPDTPNHRAAWEFFREDAQRMRDMGIFPEISTGDDVHFERD